LHKQKRVVVVFAVPSKPSQPSAFDLVYLTNLTILSYFNCTSILVYFILTPVSSRARTLVTKTGGDGGIDVVAFKGRHGELLQCKSSKANEVGWDAVKEVTAGAARYQARFAGTRFYRLAVTNQRFTSGAVEQARANQVELVTREQLEGFLRHSPITNHEYEESLMDWVLGSEAAA
jgi:hypothetical protein